MSMTRLTQTIAAAAVAAAIALGGCAAGTASSSSTTSSTIPATASSTAASASNTQLSSGTATATFDGKSVTLKAAYIVDGVSATIDGGTYASLTADENVFLVINGGSLTITNATITKSGDPAQASDDAYNFYGLNSAILVVGETSSVTIKNSTISTTSSGSNAIFSTLGATANANAVTITTTGNSARGLDATYAGKINAANMTITTQGAHCATIATDRGNGTIKVTGTNVLNTNGEGSPLIYSTGDISLDGATGTAAVSQVIVIEGKNSATLTNSNVISKGTTGIMMYQSFSGDAADANATSSHSTLTVENSTITANASSALLYVTNTRAVATWTASKLTNAGAGALVLADQGRWGTSGSNGGTLTLTTSGVTLTGTVTAGTGSSVTASLTNSSTWSGTKSGTVMLTPDSSSKAS